MKILCAIATVAFVAGGVAEAGLCSRLAKRTPEPAVDTDPVVAASPPACSALVALDPSLASTTWLPDVAPAPTGSARIRASQLSSELLVLDDAYATLARGDAQGGLDRLEHHRRQFAAPILGEERDALQVQALVRAGRYDDARASADSFRKRVPGSVFIPVVDAWLATIP